MATPPKQPKLKKNTLRRPLFMAATLLENRSKKRKFKRKDEEYQEELKEMGATGDGGGRANTKPVAKKTSPKKASTPTRKSIQNSKGSKKAREDLTDKEYRATTAKKQKDTKAGKQSSKQPKKIASKTAKSRK